jgi:hypothetical protein
VVAPLAPPPREVGSHVATWLEAHLRGICRDNIQCSTPNFMPYDYFVVVCTHAVEDNRGINFGSWELQIFS